MPYIPFTEEQKLRASLVDLVEFLRRQGEKLIRSGPEYRMTSDHSITIRGNEWYDHEAREGGGPISFVQTRYGLSYPEAVSKLLDGERGLGYTLAQKEKVTPRKEFVQPPANQEMRRVYAYLLQKRFIDREVLTAFVRRGLIYEDAKYHNAVFIGKDEHGVARHAHKRSASDMGTTFRINVEGSDPRYSFHWNGTSDRLYVFEAPIDLLSFLTLYPRDWQEHSYVALCGVGEQAMLWILGQAPNLRQVLLCLDHDKAGIEAAGRLTEILRTAHSDVRVSTLLPQNKDWNEDLKARNGLDVQPAEEHPQLVAADTVCRRIGLKCAASRPEQVERRIPALFQRYQSQLRKNRMDEAVDCVEEMAALSLLAVLRECRQLGTVLTSEQGVRYLQSRIRPHQNRDSLNRRTTEIADLVRDAVAKSERTGVRTRAEKRDIASAWLELAVSCAKVSVKYEADHPKMEPEYEQVQHDQQEMG